MVLFKLYANIQNNSYCSVDSPGYKPCCGQYFWIQSSQNGQPRPLYNGSKATQTWP